MGPWSKISLSLANISETPLETDGLRDEERGNQKREGPSAREEGLSDSRRAREDDERCGSERWEGGRHGRHGAVVELPGAEGPQVREAGC